MPENTRNFAARLSLFWRNRRPRLDCVRGDPRKPAAVQPRQMSVAQPVAWPPPRGSVICYFTDTTSGAACGDSFTEAGISSLSPAFDCVTLIVMRALFFGLISALSLLAQPPDLPPASNGVGAGNFIQQAAGAKSRTIESKMRDTVSLLDFAGVDPSGKSDSTGAVVTAYKALVQGEGHLGGTLNVPCGTYRIDSTMVFTTASGFRLRGSGGCTQFVWNGGPGSPMFLIQDCRKCEFADFVIKGNPEKSLLYGIQQINSGSGASRLSSIFNRYINIEIQGIAGYIVTAFYEGGGMDGNNDQSYLESVYAENYSHSGFTLNHSQVYDVVFNHCAFLANGYGQYGVESLQGNFHWYAGNGAANTVADFFLQTPNGGSYHIGDGRFESSAQFVRTAGPSGNIILLDIHGVSFPADCLGNSARDIRERTCSSPSGNVIEFRTPGILQIKNSRIGQVIPVPPLTICVQSITNPEYFAVEDSTFGSSNTTAATLFSHGRCALPERFLNSNYMDNAQRYHPYGDQWSVPPAVPAISLAGGELRCEAGKHLAAVYLSPNGALTGTCN